MGMFDGYIYLKRLRISLKDKIYSQGLKKNAKIMFKNAV
jgi:hypothetical protein